MAATTPGVNNLPNKEKKLSLAHGIRPAVEDELLQLRTENERQAMNEFRGERLVKDALWMALIRRNRQWEWSFVSN